MISVGFPVKESVGVHPGKVFFSHYLFYELNFSSD